MNRPLTLAGCFLASIALSSVSARADDLPAGTLKAQPATTGSETLVTSGFEARAAKAEAEAKDTTEIKLSAGGLFAAGNARSTAITSSGKLRARRGPNQLSFALAQNYGRSASTPGADTAVSVENYQGKTRYDRFLAGGFAVFTSMSGLRDRFQGLDLRVNLDPGVAYYFVDEAKQQLWGEAGYDLQYDFRRNQEIAAAAAAGHPIDKAETRHSSRLFLGYQNGISKTITLDTGFEYLQALTAAENWRVNWNVGLSSSIGGDFSIAATFTLKYDNNPLPGVKNTDSISAISLVYSLL